MTYRSSRKANSLSPSRNLWATSSKAACCPRPAWASVGRLVHRLPLVSRGGPAEDVLPQEHGRVCMEETDKRSGLLLPVATECLENVGHFHTLPASAEHVGKGPSPSQLLQRMFGNCPRYQSPEDVTDHNPTHPTIRLFQCGQAPQSHGLKSNGRHLPMRSVVQEV